jgi:hypothetical protein
LYFHHHHQNNSFEIYARNKKLINLANFLFARHYSRWKVIDLLEVKENNMYLNATSEAVVW